MSVAIITCREMPEPDSDQDLLLDALHRANVDAHLLAWDDSSAQPSPGDLCILRSTWNYHLQPDAFRAWIRRTATFARLLNPPRVLLWNLHKAYLRELEEAGLPIVPTAWIARGTPAIFGDIMQARDWERAVIKPAISAGSYETRCFHASEQAQAQEFLARIGPAHDLLIQPYMASVEEHGERALIYIDGTFTHAIRKETRFADGEEVVSNGLEPTSQELAFAKRVLEQIADPLLYARVDVMLDAQGTLLLSELELLEPSLFLAQSARALELLVAAIQRAADAPV